MNKQFKEGQETLEELRSNAEELSQTIEACRDMDLHAKANEDKLHALKDKVAALSEEVSKLKESVKLANLAHRDAQIDLQKAESTMGGKLLSSSEIASILYCSDDLLLCSHIS